MSQQNESDNPNILDYEGGVPIFKTRLDKVERKQAEAEARDQIYKDQQLSINRWMMRFTCALVILSLITIFVNGIYTYITKLSADAAKSAAETAKSSNQIAASALEDVQRAFVRVDSITIVPGIKRFPAGSQQVYEVSANFGNSGSTPAVGLINYFGVEKLIGEPDEGTFQGDVKVPNYRSYIAPNGRWSSSVEKPARFFLGGWKLGTTQIIKRPQFFWGWVVYRDVFSGTKPHLTEFCTETNVIAFEKNLAPLSPDPNAPPPQMKILYGECKSHNCTDEYCADYNEILKLATPKK